MSRHCHPTKSFSVPCFCRMTYNRARQAREATTKSGQRREGACMEKQKGTRTTRQTPSQGVRGVVVIVARCLLGSSSSKCE